MLLEPSNTEGGSSRRPPLLWVGEITRQEVYDSPLMCGVHDRVLVVCYMADIMTYAVSLCEPNEDFIDRSSFSRAHSWLRYGLAAPYCHGFEPAELILALPM